MKIIFFGTPEYVVQIANALYKTYSIPQEKGVVAVVTQPPKPIGRKQLLEYSPVDKWAFAKKIEILHDSENLPEADLGVVASYGKIIPQAAISHFPLGILNIHPSLLPNLRGASPVQGALATGLKETGLTIIKMDELMDHGSIVSYFKEEISNEDTNVTLRDRLFERSSEFLIELLPSYIAGKIRLKEQDHNKATYTKLLTKEMAYLPGKYLRAAIEGKEIIEDWEIPFVKDFKNNVINAITVYDFIRALHPWPGAWTLVNIKNEEKRLKVLESHFENDKLVIDKVQLEGKTDVSWEEFKKGYPTASFDSSKS